MRVVHANAGLALAAVSVGMMSLLGGCLSEAPEGIYPALAAETTVKLDFFHRPLPELPLPNDIATRHDPTSPTGLRINASMVAPTQFEVRVRTLIDQRDGWGVFQPITIPFTGPLDVESILAGHRDVDYDLADDRVYLVDIDPESVEYGTFHHLDIGNGNYPVVLEQRDGYWENDPRGWTMSILFDEEDEDTNGNGVLDIGEDTDADGRLDRPNYRPGTAPARSDLAARTDALMTFYEVATNTLIVRPMQPLRERTTYAVVVTRRILDAAGEPVGSPYPFINHEGQSKALAPLGELLATQSVELEDVAFAFTFTTGTYSSAWQAVRDGLYGQGVQKHLGDDFPPVVAKLEVLRDREYDDFKDIANPYILPTEDWMDAWQLVAMGLLGNENGSQMLEKQTEGLRYTDFQSVGAFDSPQLYGRFDADGVMLPFNAQSWPADLDVDPATPRSERVWFHLSVPRPEVSPRGQNKPAPVVIMSHGYTSNRFDAYQLGQYLTRHGVAVIGIDCPSHGLVLSKDEQEQAGAILNLVGLKPFLDAVANGGRALDLNGDGSADSGGDFWTAYLFHTRDVVRQCTLDHMQLVRVLRSFDGVTKWDFDVNNDGEKDLAGDFDGDGFVDIGGPDTPISMAGGSLGGIMSTLVGALEPEVTTVAPLAGGGGLGDVGLRSQQGGVREAVILRVMGPLFVGTQAADGTEMQLTTVIPDVNDTARVALGSVSGVQAGDTLVVENLSNGERGCGVAFVDDAGALKVRAGAEADINDLLRLDFYRGWALVLGDEDCAVADGQTPYVSLGEFGVDTTFQDRVFAAGDTLVALSEGLGLDRATPNIRRFLALGQMVLDGGDPAVFAKHLMREPLEYAATGTKTGAHTLLITTIGDMNVPASGGGSIGRAAGLIDYLEPLPAYGKPANQVLIDTYAYEAVHNLGRFKDPAGNPVHLDIENFSEGTDMWGTDIPRLDPPLRHKFNQRDPIGGRSTAIWPFPQPTGQHGFAMPGELVDTARKQCRKDCEAAGAESCKHCSKLQTFDVGSYMFNMMGLYLRSDGHALNADQCMSRDDCGDIPDVPPARSIGSN